jgi:mRNA interferase MazF
LVEGATAAEEILKQYEIWWADLPEPVGRRPVLLLSRDGAYRYLDRALVVEITTVIRNIPQEVRLGRREGLAKHSVANFDNIHVVPTARLRRQAGSLGWRRIVELKRAFGHAVRWSELTGL